MDIVSLHTKTWILKHCHTDVKSIYEQEKTFLDPACHFGSRSIKVADFFIYHQSLPLMLHTHAEEKRVRVRPPEAERAQAGTG